MIRLSALARNLTAETAFTVLALARSLKARGKDVVELEIGDSPFPSTPHAKAAGIRAIEENQTGYCPSLGLPRFREAAATVRRLRVRLSGRAREHRGRPRGRSRSSSTSPRRCSTRATASWSSAPTSRPTSPTSSAGGRARCWCRCRSSMRSGPGPRTSALPGDRPAAARDLPELAAQPDRRRGDRRGPGGDRRPGPGHRR